MPYLEYLFCEHCGDYARLDIDPAATIQAYRREGRENVAITPPTLIWDYLVYSCEICGRRYNYTYRDVERRVREYFSSFSEEFKEYFDAVISQAEAKEDSPTSPPTQVTLAEKKSKTQDRIRNLYTAKN